MTPNGGLVVATYNVLADAYIKPEHYPRCDPRDFLPENRHPRLLSCVAAMDVDVLLQQEVEYAMFERMCRTLRPAGYVGRWAQKWSGKPDGCATFVRAPLKVATWMILDLHDEAAAGHVALAAIIKGGEDVLTIVNTHIKWDRPDAAPEKRLGLSQVRHLLQVLEDQPHTVIGGDFNAEPDSDLLAMFGAAGFVDPHPADNTTFVSEGRPQKLDYLLHTRDLEVRSIVDAALTSDAVLPSPDEPSDHRPVVATFSPKA